MNRDTWKTLYRRMRKGAAEDVQTAMLDHGGTYWTVYLYRNEFRIHPSIIRDRATSARVADGLRWTRHYRLEAKTHRRNGSYFAHAAANSIEGAKACIAECRAVRFSGSRFHVTF